MRLQSVVQCDVPIAVLMFVTWKPFSNVGKRRQMCSSFFLFFFFILFSFGISLLREEVAGRSASSIAYKCAICTDCVPVHSFSSRYRR